MKQAIRLISLVVLTATLCRAEQVVISEVNYNPKGTLPEFIEIFNQVATPRDICDWELTGAVRYTFPSFDPAAGQDAFIHKWQRIVLTGATPEAFRAAYPTTPPDVRVFGPWEGSLNNAGERIEVRDKNGVIVSTMRYSDRDRWPRAADGAGHTLRIKNPARYANDWRNWTVSASSGGTPGTGPESSEGKAFPNPEVDLSTTFPVVDLATVYRFRDEAGAPDANWNAFDYDDAAWASGPGLFGFESATQLPNLPAPGRQTELQRDVAGGLITYYFRTEFNFDGSDIGSKIAFDHVLDDGAVFYINGQEVGRTRMPAGVVDHTTVGEKFESELEENVFSVGGDGILRQGKNVLAIELHNESAGSSDAIFGAIMRVSASAGGVVIDEVAATANNGFIEFFNPTAAAINLKDYYLTDSLDNLTKFKIASDLSIPANGHGSVGFGESGFAPGGVVSIYLIKPDGTTAVSGVSATFPGDGSSVARKPSGSTDWFLFDPPNRDAANISAGDIKDLVRLSEIHFDASGKVDWVELRGATSLATPLAGMSLASTSDLSDRVPLDGTLPGKGFMTKDVSFADDGDITIYLAAGNNILDAQRVERLSPAGASAQEFPANSGVWYSVAADTKGAANAPARNSDIVINEIMADPPSNARSGEFVELYNRGASMANVGGWEFDEGITYRIPSGTTIAPGSFLVIAADASWMRSNYGGISNVVGDFVGTLRNSGEMLRLRDGDGNLVDQVDYAAGGEWPQLVNGLGSSYELVNPMMDNDHPNAWRDSDESQKSTFKSYTADGQYVRVSGEGTADALELHVNLVGDGHIIFKDMVLQKNGVGPNLMNDPSRIVDERDSDDGGWLAQGTHWQSFIDAEGFHLIATGHGDGRANKAEIDLPDLENDDELTISFQARWVSGKPRLITQTFNHTFCPTFLLDIPNNLGTPGAQNSAYDAKVAPSMSGLIHSPAVPSDEDNVRVMAKISAPAGLVNAEVVYRESVNGNDNEWKRAVMNDAGTSGDGVAGDGIFTATIVDQKDDGRVVQYFVEATGTDGGVNRIPARAPELPGMWVVDNAEIDFDLNTYRWVISEFDVRGFRSGFTAAYNFKFPNLSNQYRGMTLIYNESEIIHGCEIRPSGSPWHAGDRTNLNKRGKWKLPTSNLLRNTQKWTFDNTIAAEGAGALHHNNMVRYWLYLLGHEVNEDEYGITIQNDSTAEFNEIVEPVGNDMLSRHWDDGSQGELYRIDDHFFFDDRYNKGQITNRYWWYDKPSSRTGKTVYPDPEGPGSYHTAWIKRSRETEYNYEPLVNMFKMVSLDEYTQEESDRMIDADKVMKMVAVRGYIGDWDSISLNRPKNSFFYRPPNGGRWQYFHWDSDLGFRANEPLVAGGSEYRSWHRKPYNERRFRHYLAELYDRYTQDSARVEAWFEAEGNASDNREYRAPNYASFFRSRRSRVFSEIDEHVDDPVAVEQPASLDGLVTLTGTAGYRVYKVVVDGHPDAKFSWTGETEWKIEGLALASGANALSVRGVNEFGVAASGDNQTVALTVNKPNNSAPILAVDSDPGSMNVALAEGLSLDASKTFDPEGHGITYTWPQANATVSVEASGDQAVLGFNSPGLYEFDVTATDSEGAASSSRKEAAVYGADGFSSFNNLTLESFWVEANVVTRDNLDRNAYYTLDSDPGRLLLHIDDFAAQPLAPLPPPLPAPTTYIDLGDTFSYDDSNADIINTFAAPEFDAAAWRSGPGLFGFESRQLQDPGLQTTFRRDAAGGLITYYLRKEFQFTKDPIGAEITFDAIIDDGARFWLNGVELGRVRLPEGEIDASTFGETVSVFDEDVLEAAVLKVDASSALVEGTNVLAVDVHNETAGSSDLVFGTKMHIAAREKVVGGGGDLPTAEHPWIYRDLPDSGDWVLQTKLTLPSLQFGEFITGLLIETGGATKERFGIGYAGGREIAALRMASSGTVGTLATAPYSASETVAVRIVRTGNNLTFQWRAADGDLWTDLTTAALTAGTTPLHGGIFSATDAPRRFETSFDYVMLIDPSDSRSPLADSLQISEVMYNPAGNTGSEYLELVNVGDQPVVLKDLLVVQGEPFDEFTFADTTIGAGEYRLLVEDRAAFKATYGDAADALVIGSWGGGKMANSGERVTLLDSAGRIIHSFQYSDSDPWPEAADGTGASLMLVNPSRRPDHSNPANWAASAGNGSPGEEGSAANPDLLAFALGADLVAPGTALYSVGTTAVGDKTHATFTYRQRADAVDLAFSVEGSRDLQTWEDAGNTVPMGDPIDNGDGTLTVTVRSAADVAGEDEYYLRLRVR